VLGKPPACKLDRQTMDKDAQKELELSSAEDWLLYNQRIEQNCAEDAVLVSACSEEDGQRLRILYDLPPEKFVILPNGVDMGCVVYSAAEERLRYQQRQNLGDTKIAVFMGSWHGPNLEAAQAVMDLAKNFDAETGVGQWQFWIMGSVCHYWEECVKDGRLNSLPNNLRLLGMLSETEKAVVLATASIALNPMSSGSGSNLKMMEYAAAGISVLTTPFGKRGLAYRDEIEVLECELPEFEARLRAFSGESKGGLESAAKTLTEKYYRWDIIAQRYIKQLLVLLPS